tara:strand:+ start:8051 stop:9382 length:1332 start_codon:yes stop_codon:yes gene_type:complete
LKFFINQKFKNLNYLELIKGSSSAMSVRILGVLATYILTIFISRSYGKDAMGLFALSQTMLMLVSVFSRFGFDTASVKFVSENLSLNKIQKLRKTYFKILKFVIPLSIILSVILYLCSSVIAINIMNKEEMITPLRIISIAILPFVLLFIHSESLRGMKKIIFYSLFRNMSSPIITATILLIFYFNNFTEVQFPIYAYVLSVFILSIISLFIWLFYMPKSNDKSKISVKITDILSVSYPMMFTSSMSYLLQWSGIIILGIFASKGEVGIYSVAVRISYITTITLFAIESIAAPKFSELYANKKMDDFKKMIHQSTKLIFWVSSPILILFLVFPTFFLSLFGGEFIVGKTVLILLVISQFITACSGSVGYILQMTGKQKTFQYIIFLSATINILLNFALVPVYGMLGTAISSLISLMFRNFVSIYMVFHYYNIITFYFPGIFRR